MDVGKDAESILFLDVGEHQHAFLQSWPTIGVDGGTIGLVERRLEDDVEVILFVESHQFLSHLFEAVHRLNDTGTCYDGWLHRVGDFRKDKRRCFQKEKQLQGSPAEEKAVGMRLQTSLGQRV